jgi:cell volume regulation protein A
MMILIARVFAVRFSLSKDEASLNDARFMSVMIPKGLAAAVLAPLALAGGIAGGGMIQNTIYSVIGLSIILTSVFVFLVQKTPVSMFVDAFFVGYNGSNSGKEKTEKKATSKDGARRPKKWRRG